jgi:hypothetical protein
MEPWEPLDPPTPPEPEQPKEILQVRVLLYDNELYIEDPENPIKQQRKFDYPQIKPSQSPKEEPLSESVVSELEKYHITEPTLTNEQKLKLLECLKKTRTSSQKGIMTWDAAR